MEALVGQVMEENLAKGMIYPPFTNIRKISAHIATKVAAKAYELGEYTFFSLFWFQVTCRDMNLCLPHYIIAL
ncbi:unnamed protein product [Ilex paraguariensis]|uniref:Malic enzyme NAD-binding domain-containing protein n=1 Tax=Ilex paraguariensis TaxID=185542 RepID=A0ABC8RLI2_9AQUA